MSAILYSTETLVKSFTRDALLMLQCYLLTARAHCPFNGHHFSFFWRLAFESAWIIDVTSLRLSKREHILFHFFSGRRGDRPWPIPVYMHRKGLLARWDRKSHFTLILPINYFCLMPRLLQLLKVFKVEKILSDCQTALIRMRHRVFRRIIRYRPRPSANYLHISGSLVVIGRLRVKVQWETLPF